jgi:phage gp46-like protein
MSDIAIKTIGKIFVLQVENGDLAKDDGLQTAVTISLFTDQRVSEDELPPEEKSKRGWWADSFPVTDQDKIGSKLWLLERVKRTAETLRKFEDYSREALNWLIEDGVAETIEVSASYDEDNQLVAAITIKKPKGRTSRYQLLWDKQELKVA